MMTDEEIVSKCEEQLDEYRTISVWHFMATKLNIPYNEMLVRRIRAKLLENNLYAEDAQIDKKGFHRIRFNRDYKKERAQKAMNIINLIVAIGALIVAIIALVIKKS